MELVRDYVKALDRGHLKQANEMRCRAYRLDPSEVQGRVAPVLEQIREDLGELSVSAAKVIRRSDTPVGDPEHPNVVVQFRLGDAPDQIQLGLVQERDELKVCGQTLADATDVLAEAPKEYLERGTVFDLVPLDERLPVPAGFSLTPASSNTAVVERLPGYVRSRHVVWTSEAGQTIRIDGHLFDTARHALNAQLEVESFYSGHVTDTIPVAGPSSRAFRHLAAPGIGIQPGSAGPQVDVATIRFSTVLFEVSIGPLRPTDDHTLMLQVTDELLGEALATGDPTIEPAPAD